MNAPWARPAPPSTWPDLRGAGVVVAVSGGGDSVGLLRGLVANSALEFDLRLSVAHLDHGTRGEEGREDARFVAELAGVAGPADRPGALASHPTRPLRGGRPPGSL